MIVCLKNAKLLFAILDEKLNEGLSKPSIDVASKTSSKIDASSQVLDLEKANKSPTSSNILSLSMSTSGAKLNHIAKSKSPAYI
jgi:hypothetical protein